MKKHLYIITIVSGILFVAGTLSAVIAQTFQEPSEVSDLPFPISTSTNPQIIEGSLGIGVTSVDAMPARADAALFVDGTTRTVDYIRAADTTAADATVAGGLLSLKGGAVEVVKILGTGQDCTSGKVCVKPAAGLGFPALSVKHDQGTALYGETTGGTAGVYGEGYYGVVALASSEFVVPLVAQSCTENAGNCFSPYGTAGYFEGDVRIDNGVLNGAGSRVFQIKSAYNLSEDDPNTSGIHEATTNGVAYESFNLNVSSIQNLTIDGNIYGIFAVESLDSGLTWKPAHTTAGLILTTNGTTTVTVSASPARLVNLVVSYELP